jgi:Flp pilus assembly protein TadD
MPDWIGAESDSTLGNAIKAKDERMLVEAAVKLLSKDQNDLKALNSLAVFYIEQGKYGIARILLTRAEKTHPTEPALQNNMGVISLNEGKQRPAIANFRKSLEAKSGYPVAAGNLGSIFVEYKDYNRAVELLAEGYSSVRGDLRKGVSIDVANNYALALSGSGDVDKAKSIFQDILKADNQNTTALLNYTILLIQKKKDKKEGEKMLNRLKFLVDDSQTRHRIDELEKALNEN